MSAAVMLHPEFCRVQYDQEQKNDLRKMMQELATDEHKFASINTQYAAFRNACEQKKHFFSDDEAFCAESMNVAPYEWIETWMAP
jgi:hypothetical protein